MTLQDYLAEKDLTLTAFAKLIGTRHARTVERYAKGQQIPDKTMMLRIVDATGSAVTPNDFFGVAANLDTASTRQASSDTSDNNIGEAA
jgi:transcriptional regulator with XRE-family HTH domain